MTIRILVGLIVPGRTGGIYVTERAIVEEWKRREGVTVRVFEYGSRSPSDRGLKRLKGLLTDLTEYVSLVKAERPSIVMLNSAFNEKALLRDILYAMLSRAYHCPLFLKWHGSYVSLVTSRHPLWRTLTRFLLRSVSGIGLLSSEERENFVQQGHPAEKLFVVKNAVDVRRFCPDRRKIPAVPTLLFPARFIPAKGLVDVIRAARILQTRGRTVSVFCLGDGPQRAEAEHLVRELGLTASVLFTGYISEEETVDYYLGSSMLVFPTYHQEGFSMTLFQSAASGLPIITTRIRAAADYLSEPENCLWVEPRNPSMLAEKVMFLLDRPELMDSMAHNNRALAEQFTPGVVGQEYMEIFLRVTGRHDRLPNAGQPALQYADTAR